MRLCFSRITYLSFGTDEIARKTERKRQSLQRCNFLTDNNVRWPIDRFYKGYIVFAGRGHQKFIEVMMLRKITFFTLLGCSVTIFRVKLRNKMFLQGKVITYINCSE